MSKMLQNFLLKCKLEVKDDPVCYLALVAAIQTDSGWSATFNVELEKTDDSSQLRIDHHFGACTSDELKPELEKHLRQVSAGHFGCTVSDVTLSTITWQQ